MMNKSTKILADLRHFLERGFEADEAAIRCWEVEANEAISDCIASN